MKMSDTLMYFALKYEGDFRREFQALETKEKVDLDKFFELKETKCFNHLTVLDQSYPDFFKEMNCPPIVLFYTGNKNLFSKDMPIKELFLEDGTRAYSTIEPRLQNGKIVFDYVVACENHDNVEKLLEHVKSKGIPLLQQEKLIDRNEKCN